MEAIKQIIRTPGNHEIIIKVPEHVLENEPVEVILIINEKKSDFKDKINELKQAAEDKIFLNDIHEISNDFRDVDFEKM